MQSQQSQNEQQPDSNNNVEDLESFPPGEWSGLENEAMQAAKSSLLLPEERLYRARIKYLPPFRGIVQQDAAIQPPVGLHGGPGFHVEFEGAAVLQLEASNVSASASSVNARTTPTGTVQDNIEGNHNKNQDPNNSIDNTIHTIHYKTMPVTITVAGRCTFSAQNYKDFATMMRSRHQAAAIHVPPNGTYDWPDVEAMILCPVCGTYQDISSIDGDYDDDVETNESEDDATEDTDDVQDAATEDTDDDKETSSVNNNNNRDDKKKEKSQNHHERELQQYWMIFYPMLQIQVERANKLILVQRTICRLVCLDCLQLLIENLHIVPDTKNTNAQPETDDNGFPVPSVQDDAVPPPLSVMDVLEHVGSVVMLQDNPPRPQHAPHVDDELDAWSLYQLWEHSGAWEALQQDTKAQLSEYMQKAMCHSDNGQKKSIHKGSAATAGLVRVESAGDKACLPFVPAKQVRCHACDRILPCHAMKKCSKCRVANYCSVDCQRKDWATHKPTCVPPQR